MSDRPIYYGTDSNTAYGGAYPGSYGGAYGGAYGGMYPGRGRRRGNGSGGDSNTILGAITLSRLARVVSQRWLSLVVFLLAGMLLAFVIYQISPVVYEAVSGFTMDMRRPTQDGELFAQSAPDYGSSYVEVFNTRMNEWHSDNIFKMVLAQYRLLRPASTVSDEELLELLDEAKLRLLRNSRLITISVRSGSPSLCADLANAYAAAIEEFTDEENRLRSDKSVRQIHISAELKRREAEALSQKLLQLRSDNQVDTLKASLETINQTLHRNINDALALEREESELEEWEKLLLAVKDDPTNYGSLAASVPRAQDIDAEYRVYQTAVSAYERLKIDFTDHHPQVVTVKNEMELAKARFIDAASRALSTGQSLLQVTRNQIALLRERREELEKRHAEIEQRIVSAEASVAQLEAECGVATRVLEGLILDENKVRIKAEANNEIVRVGHPAAVPEEPVLPNPMIIFGIGIFLSLGLGMVFILIMDNIEDTLAGVFDIEKRLALKVLAILPHVSGGKSREEMAKSLIADRYSHFSEAVASLRNLLDSPRYEQFNRCILFISTQPGEGKTITSTSLAIAYAQTGRRTLHVDFDLRRPQLAKVWGLELTPETSFSHCLQRSIRSLSDFQPLVNHTCVEDLDVIASLPPKGVHPATIFGTSVVREFFSWARRNYDRIIVDAPPFGVIGDVMPLSGLADSTIIMCCPDRTHMKPLQSCSTALTESGANILGVVVNDIVHSGSDFLNDPRNTNVNYDYGYEHEAPDPDTVADKDRSESGEFADEE